ncbi:MAG TPA: DNA mismatch repair endonuclease MutL [Methylomirabilota bacterium]|nr:DNA mismatch repair endonuclease MutL [Methylomirabilota bacterium]
MAQGIRRLPPETASRIAAGEVIERPLSALKELVENALDAGARSIEVRVERALDALFTVADDGAGIAAEELELALERHATSKLASVEELDHLDTLGFRGEAMPSIAAVSRMRLVSRPAASEAAAFVRVDGGEVVERGLVARAPGTTVEVRDLFHNTPARRKFLNSPTGELRAALRMVESYALARPATGWRFVVDGRERFAWGPAGSHRERAAQVWGASHAEQLLEASLQRGGYAVSALLGLPEHARATREGQVLLVNGRWVQSPALSQALRHAYGNLLPSGRFPAAVVWLTVPPDRLDVNVHPTKREVRFADEDTVFSLVAATCAQPLASIHPPFAVVGGASETGAVSRFVDRVREGPASGQMPLLLPVAGGEPRTELPAAFAAPPAAEAPAVVPEPTGAVREGEIWQLHRTYILAPVRDGLVIVDQHAAHERILFEEALERLRGARASSQGLLFPALVDLARSRFDLLLEVAEHLKQLGWDLAALSPPTIVIRGVPGALHVEQPGALLQQVLDGIAERGPTAQDQMMERVAASHACHTAIRAGDVLSVEAMRTLIDRLFRTSRPHGDPHGRPTFVRLELSDLHRRFGRS